MAPRAASPACSENEFDISKALFQNDSDSGKESWEQIKSKPKPKPKPIENLDMLGGGDSEDDDDDEAFIAAQQQSANRKASNLKGRTVKKGGGFQAIDRKSVV